MAMPPAVSSLLSLPSSSQSVLLARDPPTESENDPRAETSLLGPPLKKLLGLVSCVGAGSERGELDEVAAVQRKFGHLLGGDHLAEGGIGGFHRHRGRVHFDALLDGGGRELEIHFAMLVHLQADIALLRRLESLHFCANV